MSLSLPNAGATSVRQALAVDGRALNSLKAQASQGDAQATQDATLEAATQLESLFMRELIKSMREATMKSGLLEGAGGVHGDDDCPGVAGTPCPRGGGGHGDAHLGFPAGDHRGDHEENQAQKDDVDQRGHLEPHRRCGHVAAEIHGFGWLWRKWA